ncbi:B2 bradykinin receptor-like isoform X3 [Erpetoichthys calabaricus]|uniref:B2 bradykinin receptor-like isoform X3 n=1 Tax=Erpetoichthys calabaricus TaxID=27687 RepID=UPI00223406C1|nr:B2 bradykinin receptor-like isoform X3 [Erpetoichthys calabaricus]
MTSSFRMVTGTTEDVKLTPNITNYSFNGTVANFSDCSTSSVVWEWIYTVQPAYLALICILGIIGNTMVLCVFCLPKKRCTVPDIYLGNLAAADLIMILCLPFWFVTVINRLNWVFGAFLCRMVNVVIVMNLHCSILFLMLVSMDRYQALVNSLSSRKMRQTSSAKFICFGIWICGLLLSLPVMLFRTVQYIKEMNANICYLHFPSEEWKVIHNLIFSLTCFLLPALVITFCTYHMIKALRQNDMKKLSVERSEKAAVLVLIVLLAFFCCWVPYHIFKLLDILHFYNLLPGCLWEDVLDLGIQISAYLAYTNCCLNPILYVIVGKHFRRKAKDTFWQIIKHRSSHSKDCTLH